MIDLKNIQNFINNNPYLLIFILVLVGISLIAFIAVSQSTPKYNQRRLLNVSEENTLKAILVFFREHKEIGKNHKIFSQVSMGEFLSHKDRKLFFQINSKRVDFLITDSDFNPYLVIEVNGSGHYLSKDTHKRDRIKKNACESAGIIFRSTEIKKANEAFVATTKLLNSVFNV